MNRTTKIKITELNPHVICVLCGGYYINATTITECLHSFCRTCITRYLETSKYCPVCDVMVHKTRPLDYIRSDKTLQDLVYKLVPGLYKNEMRRRREYYASVDTPGVSQPPSEDRGDEFHDRIIYTEDEKISLSLELCAEGIPFKTPINVHGHTGPENIRIKDVRYLQCPAAFSVGNLKKFIRMKFDLKLKYEIDIFHTAEPLPDYYSLMDIAYIYTWTRRAPLRLYYTVYERKQPPKAPDPLLRGQVHRKGGIQGQQDIVSAKMRTLGKNMDKKRDLLEGPDDISPDLDFEKCRPYKGGRRKAIGTPRKRVKKAVIEVDDSVKEAMSESEEQLARLTLDSTADNKGVPNETGNVKSEDRQTTVKVTKDRMESNDDKSQTCVSQIETVKSVGKIESIAKRDENCNPTILTNIIVETNTQTGSGDSDTDGAIQTDKEEFCPSKQSSAQVSPGSGSISLSLFQPLNAVAEPENANNSSSVNSGVKVSDKKSEKMYEFQTEDQSVVTVKKTRGRPKGSKNKVNSESGSSIKKRTKESKTPGETEVSVVALKKHPVIKSPKANKVLKKLERKGDNSYESSPVKAKGNDGANKVSLGGKTKPVNGEKAKRKYVRKKKLEHSEDNGRETKRQKKETRVSEETEGSENDPSICEGLINDIEKDTTNSNENELKTIISDNSNVILGKEVQHRQIEETKENVQIIGKADEKLNDNDAEKQLPLNSVSLQEPITPLYGETPKVNESNQGLPCSPKMESIDSSGRLVIDTSVNNEELNGAKTEDLSDKTVANSNKTQTNGAICESLNAKNDNFVSNRALSKEINKNGLGSFEVDQSTNSCRNNTELLSAHIGQFRHAGSVNGLSPPSALSMLGAFTQPPMTAYLHIGHVTGNSNSYPSHDQSFDQPLDLTNNGTREEYTKGKIFKTKMLKKTYPKPDSVQNFKEKPITSVHECLH